MASSMHFFQNKSFMSLATIQLGKNFTCKSLVVFDCMQIMPTLCKSTYIMQQIP